jgi:hypothetical protein
LDDAVQLRFILTFSTQKSHTAAASYSPFHARGDVNGNIEEFRDVNGNIEEFSQSSDLQVQNKSESIVLVCASNRLTRLRKTLLCESTLRQCLSCHKIWISCMKREFL